jgi:cytosol aminopeptidase family protein
MDEVISQLSLITAFEDVRPLRGKAGLVDWRLNGRLSGLIRRSRFNGSRGEALLMPTGGRLDSKELLILGVGAKSALHDQEIPHLLSMIVEKLLLKGSRSFSLSLSDLIPGMFEWRNAVRLFVSMISGREEELTVTLVEEKPFVEDAKRRNMDFAYDVNVHYELV